MKNQTVLRLESLVALDRLVARESRMPYSLSWAMVCSELSELRLRLELRQEAA